MTTNTDIVRSIIDRPSIRANGSSVRRLAGLLEVGITETGASVGYLIAVGAVEKQGVFL